MKCFNEYIYSAYLDGELDQTIRKKIEAHLASCKRCSELLETLRKESLVIKETFSIDLPVLDLSQAISERIRSMEIAGPANGKKLSYAFYLVFVLSSVLFPIFIVYYFSSHIHRIREIASFFISPQSLFFETVAILQSSYLKTYIIDVSKIFLLVSLLTIITLFCTSFLLRERDLLSTLKGE